MAKTTIVFAGFATDYHTVEFMGLATPDMHYIPYAGHNPIPLATAYINTLCSDNDVHILGFSMGGHFAIELSHTVPFSSLTLVSFRPHFPHHEVQDLITRIKQNKYIALKAFYKACFSNRKDYTRFETILGKNYLEYYTEEILISQLTQLASYDTQVTDIHHPQKTICIHGLYDRISPYPEIQAFSLSSGLKLVTIEGGHISDHLNAW